MATTQLLLELLVEDVTSARALAENTGEQTKKTTCTSAPTATEAEVTTMKKY